ncbi:MAG: DUF1810 domain-containing protein [Allosphingosinicella sp.]
MASFDLERFVAAQSPVYRQALAELQRGEKRSHWMWFVFPQIAGLGSSVMSQHYAISGVDEARAYFAHPLLGPRLREATAALLAHRDRGAEEILGPIDAAKFRSSMTLFEAIADDPAPFAAALDLFYGGVRDRATLARLPDSRFLNYR